MDNPQVVSDSSWLGPRLNSNNYSLDLKSTQPTSLNNYQTTLNNQTSVGSSGFASAPQTQASGDNGGGGGGSDQVSSIFKDVAMVYNDMRQNVATNEATANSIFNRNVARKNQAMNEATTAQNLRTGEQNAEQSAITFNAQLADREAAQKTAAAWAKGVASALPTRA